MVDFIVCVVCVVVCLGCRVGSGCCWLFLCVFEQPLVLTTTDTTLVKKREPISRPPPAYLS